MKTLLLPVILFIATPLSLSAKTVKFPEKDPAFSITIPNDWTDKVNKDGDLECDAGDGSKAGFFIQKIDAKTGEEAKTYLNGMIKTVYHGDAKDAKVSESKETTTPTGVKMFGITYTGPVEGIEMFYMAVAFSPKKETWFALLDIETAAAAKTSARMGEILNSITPTSVARGGEVKVKAVLTTGPQAEPTTTFTTDTPKVLAQFKTNGAQKGDKLRAVWIADDTGGAAPAKTKIDEAHLTLEGDTDDGAFSCSKPTKGWPPGRYHVDIYANDKLATTAKFTIEAMEKAEKRDAAEKTEKKPAVEKTDDDSEESADESSDDDQYTFKVHNDNVQRITKLLASEDGKNFANFDIGKGIDVGQTVTLNWDKSTNKSSCHWYIKAVYADKSVGEAVEFNFCEEDLLIEF